MKVYDVLGREIAVLVNEELKAGSYNVVFDGTNFPSGLYIYRIVVDSFGEAGNFVETKKLVLIR